MTQYRHRFDKYAWSSSCLDWKSMTIWTNWAFVDTIKGRLTVYLSVAVYRTIHFITESMPSAWTNVIEYVLYICVLQFAASNSNSGLSRRSMKFPHRVTKQTHKNKLKSLLSDTAPSYTSECDKRKVKWNDKKSRLAIIVTDIWFSMESSEEHVNEDKVVSHIILQQRQKFRIIEFEYAYYAPCRRF